MSMSTSEYYIIYKFLFLVKTLTSGFNTGFTTTTSTPNTTTTPTDTTPDTTGIARTIFSCWKLSDYY